MAPGLTSPLSNYTQSTEKQVPRSIFPDGIKTSGQHPPLYHQLSSYQDFPDKIHGPTVWDSNDYKNNPERWTHWFTDDEIAEMSDAADNFRSAGIPLTGISKVAPQREICLLQIVTESSRTTSTFPVFPLSSSRCEANFSMAKDSYCSRASQWRNGATTSQLSRTWD